MPSRTRRRRRRLLLSFFFARRRRSVPPPLSIGAPNPTRRRRRRRRPVRGRETRLIVIVNRASGKCRPAVSARTAAAVLLLSSFFFIRKLAFFSSRRSSSRGDNDSHVAGGRCEKSSCRTARVIRASEWHFFIFSVRRNGFKRRFEHERKVTDPERHPERSRPLPQRSYVTQYCFEIISFYPIPAASHTAAPRRRGSRSRRPLFARRTRARHLLSRSTSVVKVKFRTNFSLVPAAPRPHGRRRPECVVEKIITRKQKIKTTIFIIAPLFFFTFTAYTFSYDILPSRYTKKRSR